MRDPAHPLFEEKFRRVGYFSCLASLNSFQTAVTSPFIRRLVCTNFRCVLAGVKTDESGFQLPEPGGERGQLGGGTRLFRLRG